jgi:hypothetical protein
VKPAVIFQSGASASGVPERFCAVKLWIGVQKEPG